MSDNPDFNVNKYKASWINPGGFEPNEGEEGEEANQIAPFAATSLVDGSDTLANRGMNIAFEHVPTGKTVKFKAFITSFNETYNCDWSSESVFGRTDPIHMFKQTSRTISLAWKIPAASQGEAYDNLSRVQQFLKFLYPTYTDIQQANTINMSPLIRLKLMNLAQNVTGTPGISFEEMGSPTGGQAETTETSLVTSGPSLGLLGIIKNASVAHNLDNDSGVFEMTKEASSFSGAKILPKLIELNIDFAVIHEETLGWDKQKLTFGMTSDNNETSAFPYGIKDPDQIASEQKHALTIDQAISNNSANNARILQYNEPQSEAALQEAEAEQQGIFDQIRGDLASGVENVRRLFDVNFSTSESNSDIDPQID